MTEQNIPITEKFSAENTKQENKAKKAAFRRICGKIGFSISIFYISRILCGMLISLFLSVFPNFGTTAIYAINMVFSCVFSYFIPLLATIILFSSEDTYNVAVKSLYKRPEKSARVFSVFPAVYGMGLAVNFLTLLAFYLISLVSRGGISPERSFSSISVPENIYCALIFMFLSVIIAPIAEEFWVRGIFYDALKPYGDGIAILITSIVFGLMHGNLQMLFYTTALGLALGYIRYATGSIFAPTLIHAGVNFIASAISIFLSLDTFKEAKFELSEGEEFLSVMFYVFLGIVLLLMIIGLVSFFKRIRAIRRVGIKNTWNGVRPAKKVFIFLTSLPVLIMLALAVDAHFGQWILSWLYALVY